MCLVLKSIMRMIAGVVFFNFNAMSRYLITSDIFIAKYFKNITWL